MPKRWLLCLRQNKQPNRRFGSWIYLYLHWRRVQPAAPFSRSIKKQAWLVVPAHPSPHCPTWTAPSNIPFFGFHSQSTACTKASFHLGRGGAEGLIRQFLKTKELDIWLLLASLLPSSQLQNKPEPCSAPLLSPWPGERCQREGARALGDKDEGDRAPSLQRDAASWARHLNRGGPRPSAI